jgi:hypothetical protein
MFPSSVARKIGYYVYLYVDPGTDEVFYVGKGKGNRAFVHLNDVTETEKARVIEEIQSRGDEPRVEILIHGIEDEETAYRVEAAVIDLLARDSLTNVVRGWRSGVYGRMTADQLISMYQRKSVTVEEPSILIRINELFRHGMSAVELYDATRGIWRIGKERETARFALAVFDGVVQEVYRIEAWFPAGTTFSSRGRLGGDNRWEFVGQVAEDPIRKKYRFGSVDHYFPKGARNPIRYAGLS